MKGFSTVAGGIMESSRLPVGEEGAGGEGSSQSDGIWMGWWPLGWHHSHATHHSHAIMHGWYFTETTLQFNDIPVQQLQLLSRHMGLGRWQPGVCNSGPPPPPPPISSWSWPDHIIGMSQKGCHLSDVIPVAATPLECISVGWSPPEPT